MPRPRPRPNDALLLAAALAGCIAFSSAALITIPSGPYPVPEGAFAAYPTLYPNPAVPPELCRFEDRGPANVAAVHNIHVPGTDKVLFMELPNGRHPLVDDGMTGAVFDVTNMADWHSVSSPDSVFCSGHTITNDGRIVVVGGHVNDSITTGTDEVIEYAQGLDGVRLFNASSDTRLTRSVDMAAKRWYPTVTLLADGRVLISGGVNSGSNNADGVATVEIFDPADPTLTPLPSFTMPDAYLAGFAGKPFYPIVFTLPTGHVFMYSDNGASCILNTHTGQCVLEADEANPGQQRLVSPAPRPGGWSSTYPFTATAVMGSLIPNAQNEVRQAEFIIFGGGRHADHPLFEGGEGNWRTGFETTAQASRWSHRVKLSWTRPTADAPWTYTFGDWVEEDMGYPRLMPDATLLPNGDVVILNGAQAGVAGYPIKTDSQSNYPAFWATLYQTSRPRNRYTLLCGTEQPRLYHASASLTTNGTILVAGADRNDFVQAQPGLAWFNGTGNVGPAYNVQVFHQPYVFDTTNRPTITGINSELPTQGTDVPQLAYNTRFTIQHEPGVNVTTVTLVAPSATTHSVNMNQRVVQLRVMRRSAGEVEVITPLDPFVAPPQYYMVFVSNVKTYSQAAWVRLVDTTGAGATVPKP